MASQEALCLGEDGEAVVSADRILRNSDGKTVDEIVVYDCTIHVEQLDDHMYMLRVWKGDGDLLMNFYAKGERPLHFTESCGDQWSWDEDETHR